MFAFIVVCHPMVALKFNIYILWSPQHVVPSLIAIIRGGRMGETGVSAYGPRGVGAAQVGCAVGLPEREPEI